MDRWKKQSFCGVTSLSFRSLAVCLLLFMPGMYMVVVVSCFVLQTESWRRYPGKHSDTTIMK